MGIEEPPTGPPPAYSASAAEPSANEKFPVPTTTGEPRHFDVHISPFLNHVKFSDAAEYQVDIGLGPRGAMTLRNGLGKGVILGVARFEHKLIHLCAGDPDAGKNDPTAPPAAWIEVVDDKPNEQYILPIINRQLAFRCDGWPTMWPFRLLDELQATMLAEFQPGKGRDHHFTIYDLPAELEPYILLMVARIAVQVAHLPNGPPLWVMNKYNVGYSPGMLGHITPGSAPGYGQRTKP